MPLVLTEPFNNYTAAPWTQTASPTIAAGRTGTAATMAKFTGGIADYPIPSGSQTDTITIGFAYLVSDHGGSSYDFLWLYSDSGATEHARLHMESDRKLTFFTHGSGLFTSAAPIVALNTWVYIELQVKMHDTTGFFIIRVNGTEIANFTNQDTKNAGTKTVYDSVRIGNAFGAGQQYDDLYLRNDAVFQGDPTWTQARNARTSVRVAFLTSTYVTIAPAIATGTGAITFAGVGTASIIVNASGSGAFAFAGTGTATVAFLGGSATLTFNGSGTAKISPVNLVSVGHIDFAGRADVDVNPNIGIYAPPEWSWYLLNADGSFIGALSAATARRLVFPLDGAATAQFSMPGLHPQTAKVVELATDVLVARNGRPLFRGRIGASSETHNADQDSVQFTAVDYRGMLKHRLLWVESQVIFYQVEQADIAWQLIADSQALPGGDWGVTRGTGAPTGRIRDRTYTFGSSIGQMLDELGNVIDGFEWEIDANLAFNLFYPQRGTDRGLVLTYGRDVVAVTTTINPDTYANAVYFTGSMPITLPVEVAVSTFPPEIGRWDMQKSNPSLVRADTVAEQAAAALADASMLVPTLSVTLRADVWNPYTLWVGDTVRAIAQVGRLDVDVHERVMEIDVNLNDDGVETVTLALGVAPTRLSDRFGDMEAAIAMLELQPTGLGDTPVGDYPGYPGDPFGGPGGDFPFGDWGGGGFGGGGGIQEITSSDGSIVVTNPTGPTTNLVLATGGLIFVTDARGPVVDLTLGEHVVNVYENITVLSGDYGFYSFAVGPYPTVDWLSFVPDTAAGWVPVEHPTGEDVAHILAPGWYSLTIEFATTVNPLGHEGIGGATIVVPIDLSMLPTNPFGPGDPGHFLVGYDPPTRLFSPPVRLDSSYIAAYTNIAAWGFYATPHGRIDTPGEVKITVTLTRGPLDT